METFPVNSTEFLNRLVTLTGLVPATHYTVFVSAESRAGAGQEASAVFMTASVPEFLEDPADFRVADGETAQFNCTVRSIPPPTVTWEMLGDGENVSVIMNGETLNTTTVPQGDGFSVLSTLTVVAMVNLNNGTEYRCVADNGINVIRSEPGVLLIGGE